MEVVNSEVVLRLPQWMHLIGMYLHWRPTILVLSRLLVLETHSPKKVW